MAVLRDVNWSRPHALTGHAQLLQIMFDNSVISANQIQSCDWDQRAPAATAAFLEGKMDRYVPASTAAPSASLRALHLCLFLSLYLHSVIAIPSVPVASFSLSDVTENRDDTVLELVAALEASGIISLRDIPAYAKTRAKYLQVATKCVSSPRVAGVQSKTLRDGTTRRTISTQSQLYTPSLAQSLVERDCPQYLPELRAFSELLNVVAVRLARAIDGALKTSPSPSKHEKFEDVVASAQHLDHFHAYSSPRSNTKSAKQGGDEEEENAQDDAVLSLDLHTDNGVMILMTAPAFFSLKDDRRPVHVPREKIQSGPQASAGLLIKQPRQNHVVQPVLHDDELIIMIGEGYKAWTYSTLDFKPVLHGMQMPQVSPDLGPISRAWFGKMILLPRDRPMKHLGITFQEYTQQATEFVLGHKGTDGFSAVACPPYSTPVASDKSCALKLYEPLAESRASRDECMTMCNTHADDECLALCAYVATVPSGGVDCWMLCVPNDGCASHEVAKCDPSGKQQAVCVAATAL